MLANKVDQLKHEVIVADRIASFWQKQIEFYGEQKAEAFYRKLGLNHLETKQFEWEGLTLSREPTDIEKLCIKSVAAAQDTSRATINRILSVLRTDLINQGMKDVKTLAPADYHSLVLDIPADNRTTLRNYLDRVFIQGERLVAAELAKQQIKQGNMTSGDDDLLDELTDLTTSRVANDVQARITAAAARYSLLGLSGSELWKAVEDDLKVGSVSYIDRASTGLANRVINLGREREAEDSKDEIDHVEYSAILDQNTCGPCSEADGETATNEDDLTPAPNPDCEGGDWCRCFHVYIAA